jgi:hypothetical protein
MMAGGSSSLAVGSKATSAMAFVATNRAMSDAGVRSLFTTFSVVFILY